MFPPVPGMQQLCCKMTHLVAWRVQALRGQQPVAAEAAADATAEQARAASSGAWQSMSGLDEQAAPAEAAPGSSALESKVLNTPAKQVVSPAEQRQAASAPMGVAQAVAAAAPQPIELTSSLEEMDADTANGFESLRTGMALAFLGTGRGAMQRER